MEAAYNNVQMSLSKPTKKNNLLLTSELIESRKLENQLT